jgi:hypothetical protein
MASRTVKRPAIGFLKRRSSWVGHGVRRVAASGDLLGVTRTSSESFERPPRIAFAWGVHQTGSAFLLGSGQVDGCLGTPAFAPTERKPTFHAARVLGDQPQPISVSCLTIRSEGARYRGV